MRPGPFTRTRTLYVVLLLGLAALALKPLAPVERALDLAFLPARLLPELTAPLTWLRARELRAAERSLAESAADARGRAAELLAAEQDAALPTRAELAAGRRFLHGEVVGRGEDDLDQVLVRLSTLEGVEPGMPVVAGDHFVGRVTHLAADGSPEVTVELVTGADFFVGAEAFDEAALEGGALSCSLVVGGLAPDVGLEHEALELAVHNPSRKLAGSGEVLVREPRFPLPAESAARWTAERFAELATGYRLGRLESIPLAGGGLLLRIRPGIDYQGGLFQVLVLAPEEGSAREQRLELDTFDPASWIEVSAIASGELNPARAGRRFALAPGSGLAPGAALAFGGHFLGRVERVDWLAADVRLLGDRGLAIAALARVRGEERPRPLGEIVALGRRRSDGAALFRWDARVPLGGEGAPVAAELFTGSGLTGVPRGLRIGDAELPRASGRHVIAVHGDPATRALARCEAWVGPPEPAAKESP